MIFGYYKNIFINLFKVFNINILKFLGIILMINIGVL